MDSSNKFGLKPRGSFSIKADEGNATPSADHAAQFGWQPIVNNRRLSFKNMFQNLRQEVLTEDAFAYSDDDDDGSQEDSSSPFAPDQVDFTQLSTKAYNYRWAVQADGVIPLTAADSDFPIAKEIQEAMHEYVQDGYMNYGPSEGLPELRDVIAERHNVRCEQVFVTNAAASSMFLVCQHVLQPGEEVIIADPIDFLFQRAVEQAGGVVKRYSLSPPGTKGKPHWSFEIQQVEALITSRTKMIGICNPHNPVGRVWTREELMELGDLAIRHNLKIWSDEVWSDIAFTPFISTRDLGEEYAERTFTFSKGYGLAGLRLGAILAPTARDVSSISQKCLADDTGYGVSVLSQVAGIAALERAGSWQTQFVAHVRKMCQRAVRGLNAIPNVRATMPQGTFVVFANVSYYLNLLGLSEEELVEQLKQQAEVSVVPGSPKFFGPSAAGHIRLSVATSTDVLDEALKRIKNGLQKLSQPKLVALASSAKTEVMVAPRVTGIEPRKQDRVTFHSMSA